VEAGSKVCSTGQVGWILDGESAIGQCKPMMRTCMNRAADTKQMQDERCGEGGYLLALNIGEILDVSRGMRHGIENFGVALVSAFLMGSKYRESSDEPLHDRHNHEKHGTVLPVQNLAISLFAFVYAQRPKNNYHPRPCILSFASIILTLSPTIASPKSSLTAASTLGSL
jgi:hypothetical protein